MKKLDNMSIKDLLKLIIKKLDNLAYDKTLEERIQQLETRVAVLESIHIQTPFSNPPHITWDNQPSNPTPWLPQVYGKNNTKNNE